MSEKNFLFNFIIGIEGAWFFYFLSNTLPIVLRFIIPNRDTYDIILGLVGLFLIYYHIKCYSKRNNNDSKKTIHS